MALTYKNWHNTTMQAEIEATFLNIEHDQLRSKLRAVGATLVQPMHLMKRSIYDYADLRLDQKKAWIRVRHEASKTTMGFKQRQSETPDGMREIEFDVSDYAKACEFLEAVGLKTKAVQESKREVWRLGDCEVTLDEWPWIPPYIEIEGPGEDAIQDISRQLGLNYNAAVFDSIDGVYLKYFDVTRTEISTVPIAFGQVPEWLEKKRRI